MKSESSLFTLPSLDLHFRLQSASSYCEPPVLVIGNTQFLPSWYWQSHGGSTCCLQCFVFYLRIPSICIHVICIFPFLNTQMVIYICFVFCFIPVVVYRGLIFKLYNILFSFQIFQIAPWFYFGESHLSHFAYFFWECKSSPLFSGSQRFSMWPKVSLFLEWISEWLKDWNSVWRVLPASRQDDGTLSPL